MLNEEVPNRNQSHENLAPNIWKRLFPPLRNRRGVPVISQIGIDRRSGPEMDINVFKFCLGFKVLGYFMIFLVASIIAVSYYAVVVLTCGPQFRRGGVHSFLALFVLLLFHVLLILLTWSYFMVVFKDPGSVPENWMPVTEDNMEGGSFVASSHDVVPAVSASSLSSSEGLERKRTSYCPRCRNGKPPRCHHCSICRRCVLKMDHHCVWVVNCVGACNYKFFLLFLIYTFLETTMDSLVLLPSFVRFFSEAKNHSTPPGNLAVVFLAFVLNLAFALSLLCFVVMHASLLSCNTTSIEVYEKKTAVRWKYDLGRRQNFEQVFGTKKALWLLPLFSKEDLDNVPALQGLEFPTHTDVEA